MSASVAERLAAVRERIAAAAVRSGRSPDSVTLVGVSKRQPAAAVVEAARAGLRHVGENYVQEALPKLKEVRATLEETGTNPLCWHFIGHLQRNKARVAAPAFDVVETLDRVELGAELDRRAAAAGRRLRALVQVNVSGEAQKAGIAPDAVRELLAASESWPQLEVLGLMTIPEAAEGAEASRPAFARLRSLLDELRSAPGGASLRALSMGMSGDFEVAIEEGATIVRVGTALFGPRPD